MYRERKAQRARERAFAVGITLIAYGAMFFYLTRPSPPSPFRGVDAGEGVAVSLIGLGDSSSVSRPENPLDALADQITNGLASELPPLPPERHTRVNLSDLFGSSPETSNASGAAAEGQPNGRVRTGLVGDPGAQISGGRRNVAVGPDGQVPPCWRQPERRVPVRLSIILDHQGGLIGAPEVVRPRNARRDENQSAAEAVAMRAMAGCAPFTLASAAGRYRSFELDFSKDRNWIRPTGLVELR